MENADSEGYREANESTVENFHFYWHRYGPGYCNWPVQIIAVIGLNNGSQPGGSFRRLLRQLTLVCQAQQCDLLGSDIVNQKLRQHLLDHWGFQALGSSCVVLACYSAQEVGKR